MNDVGVKQHKHTEHRQHRFACKKQIPPQLYIIFLFLDTKFLPAFSSSSIVLPAQCGCGEVQVVINELAPLHEHCGEEWMWRHLLAANQLHRHRSRIRLWKTDGTWEKWMDGVEKSGDK